MPYAGERGGERAGKEGGVAFPHREMESWSWRRRRRPRPPGIPTAAKPEQLLEEFSAHCSVAIPYSFYQRPKYVKHTTLVGLEPTNQRQYINQYPQTSRGCAKLT